MANEGDDRQFYEFPQLFAARKWDGSQEVLDFVAPYLADDTMSYDAVSGRLEVWGVPVEEGAWVIDRYGWVDTQPDDTAFTGRYLEWTQETP